MNNQKLTVTICPSASCNSLTGTPIPLRLPAAAIDMLPGVCYSLPQPNQNQKN